MANPTRLQRARRAVTNGFKAIGNLFTALFSLPSRFIAYITGRDVATSNASGDEVLEQGQQMQAEPTTPPKSFLSRLVTSVTSAPSSFFGMISSLFVKADAKKEVTLDNNDAQDFVANEHNATTSDNEEESVHGSAANKEDAEQENKVEQAQEAAEENEKSEQPAQLADAEQTQPAAEEEEKSEQPEQPEQPAQLVNAAETTKKAARSRFHMPSNPFGSTKLGLADGQKKGSTLMLSGAARSVRGFFAGKQAEHKQADAKAAQATNTVEKPATPRASNA